MIAAQHLTTYKVKILLLGGSESGKLSFCTKYSNGFSKTFEQSLGVDIFVREEKYPDGEDITYSCWVCAPERRFQYYWPKFFRGASGVFIMFDLTNRTNFEEVRFWYDTVRDNLGLVPMVLLGNKADLVVERVIDFSEARKLSNQLEFAAYLDISVKENVNVSESFELLNDIIYNFMRSETEEFHPRDLDEQTRRKIDRLSSPYG